MTPYQFARLLVERKRETYTLPQLPPPNPDDFIVWGEGEFEHAIGMIERENPPTQFQRVDEVLQGLSDKPRPASADNK